MHHMTSSRGVVGRVRNGAQTFLMTFAIDFMIALITLPCTLAREIVGKDAQNNAT